MCYFHDTKSFFANHNHLTKSNSQQVYHFWSYIFSKSRLTHLPRLNCINFKTQNDHSTPSSISCKYYVTRIRYMNENSNLSDRMIAVCRFGLISYQLNNNVTQDGDENMIEIIAQGIMSYWVPRVKLHIWCTKSDWSKRAEFSFLRFQHFEMNTHVSMKIASLYAS